MGSLFGVQIHSLVFIILIFYIFDVNNNIYVKAVWYFARNGFRNKLSHSAMIRLDTEDFQNQPEQS